MASTVSTTDIKPVTPPPLQAPNPKQKRYDRQLRLWAAKGQQALEESHILLIVPENDIELTNGSASSVAGVETLKNLVLPGIAHFTIADSATVSEADLGVNFFVRARSVGQSRAEENKTLLEELNPDVQGHAISTVGRFSSKNAGHVAEDFPADCRSPSRPTLPRSLYTRHPLWSSSIRRTS